MGRHLRWGGGGGALLDGTVAVGVNGLGWGMNGEERRGRTWVGDQMLMVSDSP